MFIRDTAIDPRFRVRLAVQGGLDLIDWSGYEVARAIG